MSQTDIQTLREYARLGVRAELAAIEVKLRSLYTLFPNEFAEAPPLLLAQPLELPGNGHRAHPTTAVATKRGDIWAKVSTMLNDVAEPLSAATLAERSGLSKQQVWNVMNQHKKDVVRDKGTYTLKKKNGK